MRELVPRGLFGLVESPVTVYCTASLCRGGPKPLSLLHQVCAPRRTRRTVGVLLRESLQGCGDRNPQGLDSGGVRGAVGSRSPAVVKERIFRVEPNTSRAKGWRAGAIAALPSASPRYEKAHTVSSFRHLHSAFDDLGSGETHERGGGRQRMGQRRRQIKNVRMRDDVLSVSFFAISQRPWLWRKGDVG